MSSTSTRPKHIDSSGGHGRHEAGRRSVHPFLVLVIVLSATFMQLLDVSIVNVATFSIQSSLHTSYSSVQLVLAGYQLAFACTLITGGRLGDIFGRRRLFLLGMLGFTLTSALCGAAVNAPMLTVSRVFQGAFSGLMFPQVLSVIQVTFKPEDRGKAFSAFGATLGLGTILGPVTGGLLIQAHLFTDDWRSIFFVNVPIGVAALIGATIYLPESKAPNAAKLDIAGALLIALGLGFVIYPLTEGRTDGWPLYLIVMLVVSAPVLAGFTFLELRKTRRDSSPLLDTGLFADRSFLVGAIMSVIFFAGVPAFFFIWALFLQAGHGFTALGSGLSTLAFAAGTAIFSARSDPITRRLGRGVLMLGCGMLAAGMAVADITVHLVGLSPHTYDFVPAMLLCGIGFGLFVPPLSTIVLAGVTPRRVGAASGSISTVQQVGGAIGVAVIGIIFFGLIGHDAGGAVTTERPNIVAGLQAQGVPAAATGQIVTGFQACYVSKASAPDPTADTPTCAKLRSQKLPGTTPAQQTRLAAYLQSEALPGSPVTRRDYISAIQLTFGYEIAVFLLAFLCVFAMPKLKLGTSAAAPHGE